MDERARTRNERVNNDAVWDSDYFAPPLEPCYEPLVCIICLDVPEAKISQCRNGHIFCDSPAPDGVRLDDHPPGCCLSQVRRMARLAGRSACCSTCREPLPSRLPRNLVAEKVADTMICKCPHPYCGLRCSRGYMLTHKSSCAFKPGALLLACSVGNVVAVKMHLKAGAPVDQAGATGHTALYFAANTGQVVLARVLLTGPHQKANPNKNCSADPDVAPLHVAATSPDLPPARREAVMRALLRAGADVNRTCRGQGRTALFEAALMGDLATVEFLLDVPGVVVNMGVVDWMSPLYAAASDGFLEVVKRLARVGGESVKNGAAANIAKRHGHTECWKLLDGMAKSARREVLQERRAKTRRLDTDYIPDHHHAPVADHIERVEIPVAAAVARASRLLPPDSVAWTRQAPHARTDDLHRGVESDSDLESEDGLGGRNGEDSDTESHSDNNSEADLESDSANSDTDGSEGD